MLTPEYLLRCASIGAWLICLGSLSPAVARLLIAKGRYLDPIWAIAFLLVLNRLSFLARVSSTFSLVTALFLALVMAGFSTWYQRHDA
ncbi:hypothetical protein [Sphingomonas nostoxanthinifaciens]|uniref:hypothetical protein n=1 Tax=Sphingomonas nostoxanthinifaciens TaxID=2872652 RepID=UPI001CC1C290|nr:hypothetical protein [Sphingomonas nostoxanthinifaciens]UAK24173.1 hypothetical protein K8P63_17880 [Sphingomonas nostoxanthinifaciens]